MNWRKQLRLVFLHADWLLSQGWETPAGLDRTRWAAVAFSVSQATRPHPETIRPSHLQITDASRLNGRVLSRDSLEIKILQSLGLVL